MKKFPRKRTVAAILLIVGALILALSAARFIHHRMEYATTDAVFIRTDSMINLGFDGVGGRIVAMNKNEGEEVAVGENLATIDDRQYRLAVTRLEAELAEAQRGLAGRKLTRDRIATETKLNEAIAADQVIQLQAEKGAIEARSSGLAAVIAQLQRDRERYVALVEAKAVAGRKVEDLHTELTSRSEEQNGLHKQAAALDAALKAAGKKVELAETSRLLIRETDEEVAALTHKIEALTASLEQARDHLDKCSLKSPVASRIARQFTSPGDVIESRQAVYALVDPRDVFAVALLEENKLNGVIAGASVVLTLDAYPDKKFSGVVQEVMPASAATFALVPRDISAGEFTKVAQRIPVRIAISGGDLSLLRVGLGGEVEIKRQTR